MLTQARIALCLAASIPFTVGACETTRGTQRVPPTPGHLHSTSRTPNALVDRLARQADLRVARPVVRPRAEVRLRTDAADTGFTNSGEMCAIWEMPAVVVTPQTWDPTGLIDEKRVRFANGLEVFEADGGEAPKFSRAFDRMEWPGAGEFLFEVDAISYGLDWIPIEWRIGDNGKARWELDPLDGYSVPLDPSDSTVGWALLTFNERGRLRSIGWGEKLLRSGILGSDSPADLAMTRRRDLSPYSRLSHLYLIDYGVLELGRPVSGLDLNVWPVTDHDRHCATPPLSIDDTMFAGTGDVPWRKVYFSVAGNDTALDTIGGMLSTPPTDNHWRSGATVFSYELVSSGGGWELKGPDVEFTPTNSESAFSLGLDARDDIDALSIDPGTGVILLSLTSDSPTHVAQNAHPFYAMRIPAFVIDTTADAGLHGDTEVARVDRVRVDGARPESDGLDSTAAPVDGDRYLMLRTPAGAGATVLPAQRQPTPLFDPGGKSLKDILEDGAGPSSIEPDTSCGHDPRWVAMRRRG